MQEGNGADPNLWTGRRTDLGDPAVTERLWLVLGGGGLKGMAHVGAWRAIRESGLQVAGVVGTSIGALVGMAIAGGLEPDEMEEQARRLKPRDIMRLRRQTLWVNGIRGSSIFRGDVLRRYIEEFVPIRTWDELRIPLQVNALELRSGATEWFGTGARTDVDPVDALYASAALPLVYPPAEINGGFYVDGATGEGLALGRARELGATAILGVDVRASRMQDPKQVVDAGMIAICQRILSIRSDASRRALVEGHGSPSPVVVRPELDGRSAFDFEDVGYFLEEGYRAARKALDCVLAGSGNGERSVNGRAS